MKKIYYAALSPTGSTDADGNFCEYQWVEKSEADHGEEWDGDVRGYVENLLEDGDEIGKATVHNCPADAVIVFHDGNPTDIYWAQEDTVETVKLYHNWAQSQILGSKSNGYYWGFNPFDGWGSQGSTDDSAIFALPSGFSVQEDAEGNAYISSQDGRPVEIISKHPADKKFDTPFLCDGGNLVPLRRMQKAEA